MKNSSLMINNIIKWYFIYYDYALNKIDLGRNNTALK